MDIRIVTFGLMLFFVAMAVMDIRAALRDRPVPVNDAAVPAASRLDDQHAREGTFRVVRIVAAIGFVLLLGWLTFLP